MRSHAMSQALAYIILALGLAILVRLAVPIIGGASLALTMLTPATAVVILLLRDPPDGGIRAAARDLGLTTLGARGIPLAIGAPVVIFAAGTLLLVLLGEVRIETAQQPGEGARLAFRFAVGLVVTTLLAMCEEVGWRGYLLPRLAGIGLVRAMLVVGFVQGLWHMPLLLTTGYYHSAGNPWIVAPMFLVTLTLAGVFYGYLRVRTGSVWPVAIAHAAVNSAYQLSIDLSQTASPAVLEYVSSESGLVAIAGLVLLDTVLIRRLRRQPSLALEGGHS